MGEKDKKFKELLNDKHIFLEFMKAFFPIEGLKEKDLIQEKTDFISKDYTEKRSDVLYKIKKDGKEIYLYILVEHQSSIDQLMVYRFLNYMVKIWDHYIENNKKGSKKKNFKLPPIIPILFYDGEKKWTPPIELKEKIKESENFKELIPNFKYHKIELNEIEEEKLLGLKNAMGTLLYLDKKIENKDILEVLEKSREIFEQFEETEKEKFRSHFYGFIKILSEKTDTDIEEEIKHYEEVQEMYESFAKKYIKEKEEAIRQGIQQGIQQGKLEAAKDLLKEKVDKKVISKAMGISIEQIKKIEEEMKEKKN